MKLNESILENKKAILLENCVVFSISVNKSAQQIFYYSVDININSSINYLKFIFLVRIFRLKRNEKRIYEIDFDLFLA